jgi:hypothetical protein
VGVPIRLPAEWKPGEGEILGAIREALTLRGWRVARCNVGKFQLADGRWFDTGIPRGFPDLAALGKNGETVFIEVKAGSNKLSAEQREWLGWLEANGHKAGVARSVGDALALAGEPQF